MLSQLLHLSIKLKRVLHNTMKTGLLFLTFLIIVLDN